MSNPFCNTKKTVFSIGTLALLCAATIAVDAKIPDDGVYKTVTVSSFQECQSLCKADNQCRGTKVVQPDTRYPTMQCMLNNGFGKNSHVSNIAPAPINYSVALADLNDYRASHGLKSLTYNRKLITASKVHAQDLAKYGNAAHEGSDGSTPAGRTERQGYHYSIVAENVATGQKSWEQVFKSWQDSPGHNKNLLQPNVTEFGVALIYEPRTTFQRYWVMLVAAPAR